MRRMLAAILILAVAGCVTTGAPNKQQLAEGYYNKGLSYLQANDYSNAMAEFHRSIQHDGKYKQSYYALGVVYDRQDKLADAEKYLKEAISIDSDYSEAYNMLGIVYSKQRKWQEALKAYNKALENKLYTSPHITYLNMGNTYMMQGEYAKAVEAYRDSKRMVNQDFTIYRLGQALVEAGRVQEAVTEFQEGIAMAPQNVDLRLALGQAYLKLGNKRSALTEFQKVIELAPKSEAATTAKDYVATIGAGSPQPKKSK